jgi:hypothetical protein
VILTQLNNVTLLARSLLLEHFTSGKKPVEIQRAISCLHPAILSSFPLSPSHLHWSLVVKVDGSYSYHWALKS